MPQRDGGDAAAPDLVGPQDLQLPQSIRVSPVSGMRLGRVASATERLDAHLSQISADAEQWRGEILALEEFENLPTTQRLTTAWAAECNDHRPHSSLGCRTPSELAASLSFAPARQTGLCTTRWKTPCPSPNQNSCNPWYRNGGHPTYAWGLAKNIDASAI